MLYTRKEAAGISSLCRPYTVVQMKLSRYAVNIMMMQTALLGINTVRMSNRILHQRAPERNKRRNDIEKQLRFQRHYWRMLSAASCLSVRRSKSQVRQSS